MVSKAKLRARMLEERKKLSADKKIEFDEVFYNKFISISAYINSKVIFVFVSCNGEIDTHKLIKHAIDCGKIVCVPKVISMREGMVPVAIESLDELKPNKLGILEPITTKQNIDVDKIDLVVVPGLAFDKNGGRLGYGGGFYDRFLPLVKETVPKIGIGYNFQIINQVPSEAHDYLLNGVVTN